MTTAGFCFSIPWEILVRDPKAGSDGGDPKVASDGGNLDRKDEPTAEYLNDDTDLHHEDAAEYIDDADGGDGGDLDREDAPRAEYLDDDAGLHHDDAAEYIDDADGGSDGVNAPRISSPDRESELGTGTPTISSPDCEANASGLPAWILLDPFSIDGDLGYDNATTAEAQTITWREDGVKVSFFVANPPCPSHFRIHVPSLMEKPYLLCGRPSILYTVRNLALMSITFYGYPSETEYYLYRVVGPGQRPSLIHLEYVSQQLKKVFHVVKVGLLPIDGDGFVLTALALEQAKGEQYGVHVFKYEQGTWTSKVHLLEHHQVGNMRLYNVEKVIALLVGELGFVDMWNGILVCNVLEENFVPRYVPLPRLLPGNQSDDQMGFSAKSFRDVIFSTDGCIKCVELEMCWKHIVHEKEKPQPSDKQEICTKTQEDVWESNMLHDSDLMHHQKQNDSEEVEETFEYLGWRFISWSRKPYFAYWRKDCSTHAKDIINTAESLLWGVQLDKLSVSFPTLSMDGSELYVVSKVHATDLESRVIMVDLGKNSIKAFSPSPTKRPDFFHQAYVVCDLFKCMNKPSDEFHVYDQKALFLKPPLLKHENILSVRTSQSMESCEGTPVGLQLIRLDDQAPFVYGCWPSDNVDWRERVGAKMKLQLSETVAKDSTLGITTVGWERFQFNKDAPIEEYNDDVEELAAEAMVSTPEPDWSKIPLELLGLVLKRLPALVDRIRFAAVCHQWHSTARQVKLPPALPLLALKDGDIFYSMPGGEPLNFAGFKKDHLDYRENGESFHTACGNWLVYQRHRDLLLLDPFSGATMTLPPPYSFSNTGISRVIKLMVCSPSLIAVLLYGMDFNWIAVCRQGGSKWSVPKKLPLLSFDMAFYQGKLYVVDHREGLVSVDISVDKKTSDPQVARVRLVITGNKFYDDPTLKRMLYLVESRGSLLLVRRRVFRRHIHGNGQIHTFAGQCEPDLIIFEADFARSQWVKVKTLDDNQALFLGPCSRAVCLTQGDSPGNRVWFLDDYKDFSRWSMYRSSLTSNTRSMAKPKPFSPLPMISWKGYIGHAGAAWIFPPN